MYSSERVISVYFSESCSPLPIKIYPDISHDEILLPITECIANVLLAYDINEFEYEIYDKKMNVLLSALRDFSKISEISVRFKKKASLNKLTFIKDDIYSSQLLNQITNELQKKKSFQLDRKTYETHSNQKIEAEEHKYTQPIENHEILKPIVPIKSPPNDSKQNSMINSGDNNNKKEEKSPQKSISHHPFLASGFLQTKSELNNMNYFLTDKKGTGYFSFLPWETPFNTDCPPPCYLKYDILKKLKGITKEEIFSGIERLNSGELKCIDREILDKQKGLVGEMIKKIMQSIAEGRGIVGVSLPVRIFEPRSLLERIVDWWVFAPIYLNEAYLLDPVSRMKSVMAFAIAGLYVSVSQVKPFNPILGETYQAAFPDGTNIYCEHTNHHPPISNFLMVGKNFRFYGRYEYLAKPNATFNEMKMFQEGPNIVEFGKDDKVEFNLPGGKLTGLMSGDRLIKWHGIMKFIDKKNGLKAVLKIGSMKKVAGGGIFGKKRSDLIEGKIYKVKKDFVEKKIKNKKDQEKEDLKYLDLEQEIGILDGSWLDNLMVAGEEVWNINKSRPIRQIPEENPLPSDARFREDLIYVKYNDLKMAEKWKVKLEERQRFEKKLRIEAAKKLKKKSRKAFFTFIKKIYPLNTNKNLI